MLVVMCVQFVGIERQGSTMGLLVAMDAKASFEEVSEKITPIRAGNFIINWQNYLPILIQVLIPNAIN